MEQKASHIARSSQSNGNSLKLPRNVLMYLWIYDSFFFLFNMAESLFLINGYGKCHSWDTRSACQLSGLKF